MGMISRVRGLSRGKKIALGVGAVGLAGAGAYGISKLMRRGKRTRKSWVEKARQMKGKRIYLEEKRKVFKEKMRLV